MNIIRSYALCRQECRENLHFIAAHEISHKTRREVEQLIKEAEIVSSTCANTYHDTINKKHNKYGLVIVDETHLAPEPEALLPISLAKHGRLVLMAPRKPKGMVFRLLAEKRIQPIVI